MRNREQKSNLSAISLTNMNNIIVLPNKRNGISK